MRKGSLIFAEFTVKLLIAATCLIVVAVAFVPVTVGIATLYGLGRLLDVTIRARARIRYDDSTFRMVQQYAERLPPGAIFRTSDDHRKRVRELGCEVTDSPNQGASIDVVEFRKL